MTNKVKPFYIRITDDMTPQMVQDAFDKCVDAGVTPCDSINEAQSRDAQEITLDQLDEWLGLEVEKEWKNGDACVFDNKTRRNFDNPLLDDEYQNQSAIVHHTFKNKNKFDMVLIEFEDGYCAAVMQECISKPETPEQKAERERLEYINYIDELYSNLSPECKENISRAAREIIEKTNYRKQ